MTSRVAVGESPRLTWRVTGLILLLILVTFGKGGADPDWMMVWHSLVLLLVVAELLRPAGAHSSRPLATRPLTWFCVFFALVLLGALLAPFGYGALLTVLELLAFLAVAAIAARCGPDLAERLSVPLLALAAAQALWMLAQRGFGTASRPAAGLFNPNHLAAWLVAVLLLAWAGQIFHRPFRHARGAMLAGLSLPVVLALILVGSRGALLGLVAGGGAMLVMIWRRLPTRWRRWSVATSCILIALAGVAIVLRFRQEDPFRYQRWQIWRASLEVAIEHPLLGSGPGQFATVARNHQFPDGDGPLRYDRGFRTTHSDWLRVPCELGWPAALALAIALAAAAAEIRRRRRADASPEATAGAIAALLALGTQALVENLSSRPALYILAAALLGSVLAAPPVEGRRWPAALRWVVVTLLVVGVLIGDAAPWVAWRSVKGLSRGRLGSPELARLERALVLNRVHPDYRRRLAEHIAGDGSDWDALSYASAREASEHAIRLHPTSAEFHRALAGLEALACRTLFADRATRDRARVTFERAESLDRYNAFIPLQSAAFLLGTGDARGAARAAERALRLEPESVLPRLLLADAVLEADGEDAAPRASALLDEARKKADRWASWAGTSEYARTMLALDRQAVARLELDLDRFSESREALSIRR